ncbi:hypothetical protein EDF56_11350 [Novosphingobium sp. PhB165]|uniref:hypothetical protein n=1 Tax=Novosphingobium sp. PhB165 TaxID=2485105 RepID=UPI00104CDF7C|nr:hypothetical protein [Novosphingobium sp. PhB165]TCM14405.1 hypothetical protein EDF56_11350 [Novosphingobium sp. PhB165]
MAKFMFETPDGDEVMVNSMQVVALVEGRDDQVTIIELEDGEEVSVLATRQEVVAHLDLDPLEFLSGEYAGDDLPEDADEGEYDDE